MLQKILIKVETVEKTMNEIKGAGAGLSVSSARDKKGLVILVYQLLALYR